MLSKVARCHAIPPFRKNIMIIIIIIISILKPVFLYRGLGLSDKSSSKAFSTQSGSEGQQSPFQASFCHPTALHSMFSLAYHISYMQLHLTCILNQSSLCCALRAQATLSYWCKAPHPSPGYQALGEGSLS